MACKVVTRPKDALPLPHGKPFLGPTSSIKDLTPILEFANQSIKSRNGRRDTKDEKKKQPDFQLDDKRILREAAISFLMNHPNIVSLKEMIVDQHHYYLFFEFVDGGQLLDFIISHGMLNEKLARRFMRQIISAVDYCHQNSIVHRDLKIENILIDKNGVAKLIDFGLANIFSPYSHLNTFCGSLYFAAPELLCARNYVGPEVDMWSLGVILYVLVCGKVPFDDATMPALHAKIKKGDYKPPTHVSRECAHLISRLLVVDPKQRAPIDEVKSHAWILALGTHSPENFVPPRVDLTLPVDMSIVSRMKGFPRIGKDADIKATLEAHIQDGRPQGPQKWLVGGRPMTCPESPVVSLYYLISENLQRKKKQSSLLRRIADSKDGSGRLWSNEKSLNSSLKKDPFVASNEYKRQRKPLWGLFGKKAGEPSLEESVAVPPPAEGLPPIPKGESRPSFGQKFLGTLRRRSGSRSREAETDSVPSGQHPSPPLTPPPTQMDEEADLKARFRKLQMGSKSASSNAVNEHEDDDEDRRDSQKNIRPTSMIAYNSDKDLPAIPGFEDTDDRRRQQKTGFMATLRRRGSKRRAKSQTDLSKVDGSETAKKSSRLKITPSFAALKSLTSKVRLINRNDRDASQDQPGASTSEVKTAYIESIFTIRNTTPLPPEAIRTELLRAFGRVSHLVAIEQPGGFYCKFYDPSKFKPAVPEKEGSPLEPHEKQERQLGMFSSMWKVLGTSSQKYEDEDKDLPVLPPVEDGLRQSIGPAPIPDGAKPIVQLEIFIRKIPWSNLHGVQFRQISGDPWKVNISIA